MTERALPAMSERALPLHREGVRDGLPPRAAASLRPSPRLAAATSEGAIAQRPPRALRALPDVDARPAAHPRVVAGPRAVVRPRAATRRPVHVAVFVGVSAGLYAVSLAGVTALQAGTDSRLAAERAPVAAAVDAMRSSHDALDSDLAGLSARYGDAAAAYQSIADAIAGHEASLVDLAGLVRTVEGSAAALKVPTITRLPAVSTRTVYVSSRPATNACTTASGKPC